MADPINGSSPTEGVGGSDPRVTIVSTYTGAPAPLKGDSVEGYALRFYGFNGVEIYTPTDVTLGDGFAIRLASFGGVYVYKPDFVTLSDNYTII